MKDCLSDERNPRMRFTKLRLIFVSMFLLAIIGLNAIPSKPKQQTPDENAQAANGVVCTVQHWGWPFPLYSKYGGGGYISPMELLVTEATPIFSQWHIFGLIMDGVIGVGGLLLLLWFRLPGLPGEGQENIPIVRESERIEDEED